MQVEIVARGGRKRRLIEAILPSIISQVGLARSRASLLVVLRSDMEDSGIAVPLMQGVYCVAVNSRLSLNELSVSLSHEMVHIAQMVKGKLKPGPRGGHYWSGKFYPASTAYLDLPWEIAAFSRQEIIARRAFDSI